MLFLSRTSLRFATALMFLAPAPAAASCMCLLRPPSTSLADEGVVENPATAVFLLRDGTRTILTVEPAYDGPVTTVSMVIPLPHAIERGDVRTISGSHFRRLDRATAPRVTHQWLGCGLTRRRRSLRGRATGGTVSGYSEGSLGVVVEEEWEVDEYDVSLLNAAESAGLLTFLAQRGLELPDRAGSVLRSYIETGHRFALVQVDPSRAHIIGQTMVLPPLQFQYESHELVVPVRLGTLNSPGEQELLLYVLSRDGRFEVANRPALLAPTGAELRDDYEGGFAAFYEGLMHEVFRENPGAAVTEYARPLGTLGATARQAWFLGLDRYRDQSARYGLSWRDAQRWTLTRIRHRYGTELDTDLVLRPAAPVRSLEANDWVSMPRGASAFRVRFSVVHRGDTCPGFNTQSRLAGEWATSESTWRVEEPTWPGDVLLTSLLGIEPGSTRPEVVTPEPEPDIAASVGTPADEPMSASKTSPGVSPPSANAEGSGDIWPRALGATLGISLIGGAIFLRRRRGSAGRT